MKLRTKPIVVSALLLSLALVPTWASETPTQNQRRNQQSSGQPNREEVEGMMEAYILSKLQDSLDLTDEQFGNMVVAQKKLTDTRREYRQSRMSVLQQMRRTLQRDQAADNELQPLLTQLTTLQDEFITNERTRYAAIDAVLDVRQQARYRILEVELQRRLAEMMRQVRRNRNDARPNDFP